MKYISVCSGIEAATCAWHSLGWTPLAFSEIEPFPCKVLAHHYPTVPNLGDMTKFKEWPDYANVDVLVGGTPCQSFSIAGLRKGLDDPRGNLMLTYLAIADKYRPTWLVWENVPGVLSSNGGKDFGTFLGGLGQLGYGFAYRVLDAQYVRTDGYPYAVPQRRRRVFVVGHLGNWQRAAAVLFDTESMRGNPAPRREAGQSVAGTFKACAGSGGWSNSADHAAAGFMLPVAGTLGSRTTGGGGLGTDFDLAGGLQAVAPTLDAHYGNKMGLDNQHINSGGGCSSISKTLITKTRLDAETETPIPTIGGVFDDCNHEAPIAFCLQHAQIGRKDSAGPQGKGYIQDVAFTQDSRACADAVAYHTNAAGQVDAQDGIAAALNTQTDPCAQILAYDMRGREGGAQLEGPHDTANIRASSGGSSRSYVQSSMQVRRLMPIECERLQGFLDNYTNIPGASDTTRYKALGNSMAVNVMQLIGQRIQMVSEIPLSIERAA